MATSPELLEAVKVTFIGRLGDLGLGNPEGIPSKLAEANREDLELFGEQLLASSKPITDYEHDSCIDGRHTNSNQDGSAPEIRERHVSGSASNTEIAMNAEAPVMDTISPDATLSETIDTIDSYVETISGKKRAAHTVGCGGANGAVIHNELIAIDPAPLAATEALMNIPEVRSLTGVVYDPQLADAVKSQAAHTAKWLKTNGWDGQTYVDKAAKHEPSGVEVLRGGDDKYHGHAENALVIDLREGEVVTLDDTFVVSMSAVVKKTKALAGERGQQGYTQALIADVAKHMAVAKVLPSDKTPVFLIG